MIYEFVSKGIYLREKVTCIELFHPHAIEEMDEQFMGVLLAELG